MRTSPPALMPLFRSRYQPALLAELYLHENEERSMSDLARITGIPYSTVARELNRLADAGLLVVNTRGRGRYVMPNVDSHYNQTLRSLTEQTFGPLPILREVLSGIENVLYAGIYGSWAARYTDQPGELPNDVDVLVLGEPNMRQLRSTLRHAEERLRLEVNPTVRTYEEWVDDESGFKKELKSRPLVDLIGSLP